MSPVSARPDTSARLDPEKPAPDKKRWVAATSPSKRRRTAGDRRPGIPALDGIRAIAVALVLAHHGGVPGVSGGFLGVDVFFVLSGFLITSILIEELGRTGRIGLKDFWIRRARRLLPAMLLMVAAVVVARQLFAPDSVAQLRDDAVATFLWVANWSFVARDTDYFTQGGAPSPLQHAWSLGVEEQYYLIWPLLLIGLTVAMAAIARRRGNEATVRSVRIGVFVVASLGAAASAAAAVLMSTDATRDRVYFGTDTRVQALLVGAAAAALLVKDWSAMTAGWSTIRTRWGKWMARLLPVLGLAGLAAAAHYATGTATEFRHGLFIAVAAATVLVVASVALVQDGPVARVLGWWPLAWLGGISYGIYLWHWPVFLVIDGERTGWTGLSLFVVRTIATIGIAALSWWLVEQPIRRWRPLHVPQLRLAAAAVATAAVVTMVTVPVGAPRTVADIMAADISSAAAVSSPEEVMRRDQEAPRAVPPGARTVAVFGDSIGWTLMRYLPPTKGLHFIDRTTIGCGIVRGGPYRYAGEVLEQKPECDTWPARWANRIAHDRPDVVLLVIGRWELVNRMHDGEWTNIGNADFEEYLAGELRNALTILSSTGARVVVTTEPYNRRGEQPNGKPFPEDEPRRVQKWNALLEEVLEEFPRIEVLDLNDKLNPNGYYTNRVDGIQMRSDGVHPTADAVKWLAPWLVKALKG